MTNNVGHIFILSNLHVLKQAGIGAGDAEIIQPAHLTGGSYTDVVADYVDGDATLDAEIARVRPGLQVTQTIAGQNGFTISGTANPYQWQLVKKRGCATGFRRGEVSDAQERSVPMLRPGFGDVAHLLQITRDGDHDEVNDLGFQLPGGLRDHIMRPSGSRRRINEYGWWQQTADGACDRDYAHPAKV